jgi:CSLREA domain-containing protein
VRGRFQLSIARVLASRFSRASLGVWVLVLWALVGAAPAAANTINVNSTADVIANDGQCTLREAITAANTDTASGNASGECPAGSGADTIVVPAGTYKETLTGFEDSNAGGDFDLYSDLTIQGAGSGSTFIDGNEVDRVFDVFQLSPRPAPTVTIKDVTIQNGQAPTVSGHTPNGGGVLVSSPATLTLNRDVVTHNTAGNGYASGVQGGSGGGIASTGTLTVDGTTVSFNTAGHSYYTDAAGGDGGGIYNSGSATISTSTVASNSAGYGGSGGLGGGIDNSGSLTISGTTVSSNTAGAGGDVGENTFGAGGDGGGIANTPPSGTLSLDTSTVSSNTAGAAGTDSDFNGGGGGGIFVEAGTTTLTDSTIASNNAGQGSSWGGGTGCDSTGGGGSVTFGGLGGGVYFFGGAAPTATNVTIADNGAGLGGAWNGSPCPAYNGAGGGFYTGNGDLALANSIVASSTVGLNCDGNFSVLQDDGHNLGFGDSSCPAGFATGDPNLGPLQDNGGPTETMALGLGSAALDQVPSSGANCPASDQRGVTRPEGPACDIGAFELAYHALNVAKAGSGSGAVSSTGATIDCGATCSNTYLEGTTVTLNATPAAGSSFTGWSGAGCSGTSRCTVTMSADQNVTATFTQITHTLAVSVKGTGPGTVTGTGIHCPGRCSHTYNFGTIVTLAATPATGSTFAGWSGGGCSGTGKCTVTINADQNVIADFRHASGPPPPTSTIGTHPKRNVTTSHKKAEVKFTFSSNERGATFKCKLDKNPFKPCSSPKTYKVRRGKHTFSVEAINTAGETGALATTRFKVIPK